MNEIERRFASLTNSNNVQERPMPEHEHDPEEHVCDDNCGDPFLEGFLHAIGHAEDFAGEIEDPVFAAQAWASIAQAWGHFA